MYMMVRRHQEAVLWSRIMEDGEKRLKGAWDFSAILESVGSTLSVEFTKKSK